MRRSTILAIGGFIVVMILVGASVVFLILTAAVPTPGQWAFRGWSLPIAVANASVGALIATQRPRNPIGWLFLFGGIGFALDELGTHYATYSQLVATAPLPGVLQLAWLQSWLWLPSSAPFLVVMNLFPDGKTLTRAWRAVLWFLGLSVALACVGFALRPGPLENFTALSNPYGVDALPVDLVAGVGLAFASLSAVASGVSLAFRFRRSRGERRQQIKWMAAAGVIVGACLVAGSIITIARVPVTAVQTVIALSFLTLPIASGIAMMRYRLYDLDALIARTILYTALSAILAGLYTALVALLQRAFIGVTGEKSDAAIVLATLVLATSFTPIRNALQVAIDRKLKPATAPLLQHLDPTVEEVIRRIVREEMRESDARGAAGIR